MKSRRALSLEVPEAPLRLHAENLEEMLKGEKALVVIDVRGEDYQVPRGVGSVWRVQWRWVVFLLAVSVVEESQSFFVPLHHHSESFAGLGARLTGNPDTPCVPGLSTALGGTRARGRLPDEMGIGARTEWQHHVAALYMLPHLCTSLPPSGGAHHRQHQLPVRRVPRQPGQPRRGPRKGGAGGLLLHELPGQYPPSPGAV